MRFWLQLLLLLYWWKALLMTNFNNCRLQDYRLDPRWPASCQTGLDWGNSRHGGESEKMQWSSLHSEENWSLACFKPNPLMRRQPCSHLWNSPSFIVIFHQNSSDSLFSPNRMNKSLLPTAEQFRSVISSSQGTTPARRTHQTMKVTLKARAGRRRRRSETTVRRRRIRSRSSRMRCPKCPGEVKKCSTPTPSQILAALSPRGPRTTVERDPAERPGHVTTVRRDGIPPASFLKTLSFRLSRRRPLTAGLQVSVRPRKRRRHQASVFSFSSSCRFVSCWRRDLPRSDASRHTPERRDSGRYETTSWSTLKNWIQLEANKTWNPRSACSSLSHRLLQPVCFCAERAAEAAAGRSKALHWEQQAASWSPAEEPGAAKLQVHHAAGHPGGELPVKLFVKAAVHCL